MLILDKVNTGYGAGQVLFDLSMRVEPGECVSLMGRNGMGKTTTIRAIMGQLSVQSGHIHRFDLADQNLESFEIARAGIGLVPEGRLIFPNLSVAENLKTFFRPARATANMNGRLRASLICFRAFRNGLSITAIICREVSSRCWPLAGP